MYRMDYTSEMHTSFCLFVLVWFVFLMALLCNFVVNSTLRYVV